MNKYKCDCEPFQSCDKCRNKTEWRQLSEMKENIEYRFLDKDNNIGKGVLNDQNMIIYNTMESQIEFGTPVMFAEIKPPEVPC